VIDRVQGQQSSAVALRQQMVDARLHAREHSEADLAVRDWVWPDARTAGVAATPSDDTSDDHG
jgi:hypothetical protein